MANEIEIRIVTKDNSAAGFDSANKKADDLKHSVQGIATVAGASDKAVGGLDKSVDKLGNESEQSAKKSAQLGSALGKIGTVAAGILTAHLFEGMADRAKDFLSSTVEAASSLGESLNATNKIFQGNANEVQDWARQNANSLGLSQRAFNELATPLGAMLKNSGLSLDLVTDNTTKLTERAADLASVFNTDVSDALTAIQAGLRGESDPLERYGVGLSAAAVETRALTDTGKESVTQLTNQEKMLARLAIIYDQTNDSAGDFRSTSDGLANSQRIATAEIEDAKAKIGTAFIPVMAKAAQVSAEFATSVGNLPGPVQMVVAGVVGLAGAALILTPRILATKTALEELKGSESKVTAGFGKSVAVLGKVSAALAGVAIAGQIVGAALGTSLSPQLDAATKGLEDWDGKTQLAGESARLFGGDAEELQRALAAAADHGFSHWSDSVSNAVLGFVGLNSGFTESTERVNTFDSALADLVKNGHAENAGKIVAEMALKANISVEDAKKALPQYAAAIEVAAKGTDKLSTAAQGAAVNIDDLDRSFDDIIDKSFSLEETQDKIADALARLGDQIKQQRDEHEKGAGTLDRNTQAGRDNAAAVRDLVRDYEDLMVTYKKAGKSTEGLQQQLEDSLVALGLSRDAAHAYASQLANVNQQLQAIPDVTNKTVNFRVNNVGEVMGGIGRIQDRATGGPSSGLQTAATGGARGGVIRMNEQGGELVRLPNGSMVYPAGQSQRMMAAMSGNGGGGSNAPLVIESGGSRFDDLLVEVLRNAISRRGGVVQNVLGKGRLGVGV